jgi:tetratricopeptide (TPR) repeat protein
VQGDIDRAIQYYKQALVISRITGNRTLEGFVSGNLGNIYVEQGKYEIAKKQLNAP